MFLENVIDGWRLPIFEALSLTDGVHREKDSVNVETIAALACRRQPSEDDSERGASLVEYALLVAFIAIVCVAAVSLLGGVTASQYSSMSSGLN